MADPIVTINLSSISAGTPDVFQRKGAFVSIGGSTGATNSLTLVKSLADLTAILAPSVSLTTLTWTASVVTGTTSVPHGWANGDIVQAVISGEVPVGYNGTFAITITGASTFTYPLVANPGAQTVPGKVTLYAESELLQMGTTYFAQGSAVGVYVLELGEHTVTAGIAALATWITNNPRQIYSYEVPAAFAGDSTYLTLISNYAAPTAMQYFFTTVTSGNYASIPAVKSAFTLIEAPAAPAPEFTISAAFYRWLNQRPSSGNKLLPMDFAFQYGVTAYPTAGNAALLALLSTANVNVIDTGAEGLLTNTILRDGTLMDGHDASYWYGTDWVQINVKAALANEVINGSNVRSNPLYYNQPGINRLQGRAAGVMSQAISSGIALGNLVQLSLPIDEFNENYNNGLYNGQVVVNAEPFVAYTTENPGDYTIGEYDGITIVFTDQRGFRHIIANITVADFPTV